MTATLEPGNLRALNAYWESLGGEGLGIVGDSRHVHAGTSYHLGRDQLKPGAYSAITARDRAGLSVYASAIDLGRYKGGLTKLRDFSDWLVAQARSNAPDTRDIREIIWWDRRSGTVMRWDRERGVGSAPRSGEGDATHKDHTHISFYRDSRGRDQTGFMRRFFAPAHTTHVHIASNASIRRFTYGPADANGKHCIASWTDERWGRPSATFACTEPVHRDTCKRAPNGEPVSGAFTVQLLTGPLAKAVIRVVPGQTLDGVTVL